MCTIYSMTPNMASANKDPVRASSSWQWDNVCRFPVLTVSDLEMLGRRTVAWALFLWPSPSVCDMVCCLFLWLSVFVGWSRSYRPPLLLHIWLACHSVGLDLCQVSCPPLILVKNRGKLGVQNICLLTALWVSRPGGIVQGSYSWAVCSSFSQSSRIV